MTYPPSPYPEPPGTAAITWRSRTNTQSYTYVAVHIIGCGWYPSGQLTHPLSWDALCHMLPPEDGRFLVLGVVGQITSHSQNGAL